MAYRRAFGSRRRVTSSRRRGSPRRRRRGFSSAQPMRQRLGRRF